MEGRSQAFQRGFNMVMQMHGMKQRGQQMTTQKQQFQEEMALNKRKVDLTEEAKKLQEKVTTKELEKVGLEVTIKRNKQKAQEMLLGAGKSPGGMTPQMLSMAAALSGEFGGAAQALKLEQPSQPKSPFSWFIKKFPDATMNQVQDFMKGIKAPSSDKLRELDVVAQSVGVSPQSLRDKSLTKIEADKIINALIKQRKWTLMGALLGISGGTAAPGSTGKKAGDFIK